MPIINSASQHHVQLANSQATSFPAYKQKNLKLAESFLGAMNKSPFNTSKEEEIKSLSKNVGSISSKLECKSVEKEARVLKRELRSVYIYEYKRDGARNTPESWYAKRHQALLEAYLAAKDVQHGVRYK